MRKLKHGGDRKSKYQNDTLINTADKISEEYGVSRPTIFRDAEVTLDFVTFSVYDRTGLRYMTMTVV